MTPTNWPNPERPGYPMFPERDGLHFLSKEEIPVAAFWMKNISAWGIEGEDGFLSPENAKDEGFSYKSTALTPTQLTELLAGERERCVEALQDVAEEYRKNAEEVGTVMATNSAEEKIEAVDDCWVKIRNLGDAP
ncbi:hypothetical protein [Acetobacter sp. KSO5]|uniref:hypothetical protein n=1 Tax=Acetobacter sp. KSO5 TaxID=3373674 RepID=UPI00376F0896